MVWGEGIGVIMGGLRIFELDHAEEGELREKLVRCCGWEGSEEGEGLLCIIIDWDYGVSVMSWLCMSMPQELGSSAYY